MSALLVGVLLAFAAATLNGVQAQSQQQQLVQFTILAAPESTEPLRDVQPPKLMLMVQRMDPNHEIAGFDVESSHVFMVDEKEQLASRVLNWTDIFPHVQIGDIPVVCTTLPRGNCTGISMSTWTLWHTLFGLTETDAPAGRRFRFHFPVVLRRVALASTSTSSTTEIIVANQDATVTFVCEDCAGHHLRSQMSWTDSWILGGIFFGLLVCMFAGLCWAQSADQNVPRSTVTTRTETTYA